MARKVVDGDTGETVELDGNVHAFIVRLGDEQFDRVREHQARLSRACRKPVSRAAAVRELLAHVLPRKRRKVQGAGTLDLFGNVFRRDPLVAVEAQEVARRAAERLIKR